MPTQTMIAIIIDEIRIINSDISSQFIEINNKSRFLHSLRFNYISYN
jgi:uncharacterized ubiquitin-like protein YukD